MSSFKYYICFKIDDDDDEYVLKLMLKLYHEIAPCL